MSIESGRLGVRCARRPTAMAQKTPPKPPDSVLRGSAHVSNCVYTIPEPLMAETELDIKQWGNNLGVRRPAAVAKAANLRVDQRVRVSVEGRTVVITLVDSEPLTLAQRLALFDPSKHAGEVMVAPLEGAERWKRVRNGDRREQRPATALTIRSRSPLTKRLAPQRESTTCSAISRNHSTGVSGERSSIDGSGLRMRCLLLCARV